MKLDEFHCQSHSAIAEILQDLQIARFLAFQTATQFEDIQVGNLFLFKTIRQIHKVGREVENLSQLIEDFVSHEILNKLEEL